MRMKYHIKQYNGKDIKFYIYNNTLWLDVKYIIKYIHSKCGEWEAVMFTTEHEKIFIPGYANIRRWGMNEVIQYSISGLLNYILVKYKGEELLPLNKFEKWFIKKCDSWLADGFFVDRDLLDEVRYRLA